jgi:hypothetical protein
MEDGCNTDFPNPTVKFYWNKCGSADHKDGICNYYRVTAIQFSPQPSSWPALEKFIIGQTS